MTDNKILTLPANSKHLITILVLAVICIYSQTIFFRLIFFDDNVLVQNVAGSSNWVNKITQAFSSNYLDAHYYRPLTILFFSFDSFIGQGSIAVFHITNVIIHLVTILVLFTLLQKINYSKHFAFLASLFFAITSIQVNAVGWIAGRADLLSGMFSVISFSYFISFKNTGKVRYASVAIVSLAAAILSKETALLLPVAILIFVLWDKYFSKEKVKMFYLVAALFLLIILYVQLRIWLLEFVNKENLNYSTFLENMFIIPETISKTFLPFGIKALSGYSLFNTVSGVFIGLLLLVLPFILKQVNKSRYFFAYSFFILIMFPGLFFRTNPLDQSLYWDCRSYLPMIFMAVMLAEIGTAALNNFSSKKTIILIAFYFVIIIIGSLYHIRKYENPEVYWGNVLNDYPNGYLSYSLLSQYYFSIGKPERAESYLVKAVNHSPNHVKLRQWLINYYLEKKDYSKGYVVISLGLKFLPDESLFIRDLILIATISNKVELIDDYYFNTIHNHNTMTKLLEILSEEYSSMEKYIDKASRTKFNERINKLNSIIGNSK